MFLEKIDLTNQSLQSFVNSQIEKICLVSLLSNTSRDAEKDQDLQVQPFVAALKNQKLWGHFRMYNANVDVMKIVIEKRIVGRALESGVSRARDECFFYGSSAFARNGVYASCVCLLSRANRFFLPDG